MMPTIYCISGLGADKNVFQYLDLSFANVVFIKWKTPLHNESLSNYAMRLKEEYIHTENPVILGLSLGGMIAVEIAKLIPSANVVIISSAKTMNEIPFYWKLFKAIPVYKVLPDWSVRQHSLMREYFLGAKNVRAKRYVKHVAKHANGNFYRWAIGAILNWQNETIPSNVTHLHGTNDKLLPYKFVQSNITIDNGGHLMIIENAEEIALKLKQLISA